MSTLYDDVFLVYGSMEDQREQVAAVLQSKSLEPKTILLLAFRCAMTTRPHTQSAITEEQFLDFAYFSGYANGHAYAPPVPKMHFSPVIPLDVDDGVTPLDGSGVDGAASFSRSSEFAVPKRSRLFRRLGRAELSEVFDVCVRSQGVMNEHAFALGVAHLHMLRHLSERGNNMPEVGSKSVRMTLSEAAEHLSMYVRPRTQAFPFPTEYYDSCSTPLRCLWRYSEGLETFFRRYCHGGRRGSGGCFDGASCQNCMVDVGVIPQLSPQSVERLFAQVLLRFPDPEAEGAITQEGFFELLARVAGALYADDVFSNRVTLESKIDHLMTTVFAASHASLYNTPLPCEAEEIPHPSVTSVAPSETTLQPGAAGGALVVSVSGDYFGALGRGMWVCSTLSPSLLPVPQAAINDDTVELSLVPEQSIPWDDCVVTAVDEGPSPSRFTFTFRHRVRFTLGNTPEDTLHRCPSVDHQLTLLSTPDVVQLSPAAVAAIEAAFADGCTQIAYNKVHLYDFCFEYVCTRYQVGSCLTIRNWAALGLSGTWDSIPFPSSGALLMGMFARFAKPKESQRPTAITNPLSQSAGAGSPAQSVIIGENGDAPSTAATVRVALSMASFTEILCRLAMSTGTEASNVEPLIMDMMRPSVTKVSTPMDGPLRAGDRRSTVAGTGLDAPEVTSRRGTRTNSVFSRRVSEFGTSESSHDFTRDGSFSAAPPQGSQSGFRPRAKSFRENEAILRTVATEQRTIKGLKQSISELKSKVEGAELKDERWKSIRQDVQSTMAQLRGVLELVLPESASSGVQIASKLAAVYRTQLLGMCEKVGNVMRTDDETAASDAAGGGSTQMDLDTVRKALQAHLDDSTAGKPHGASHNNATTAAGTATQPVVARKSILSQLAPKPREEVDERLAQWEAEKAELVAEAARIRHHANDLETILLAASASREKAEQETATVRVALAQQRAAHERELVSLRAVVSAKTEESKQAEVERAKAEKASKTMEGFVQQRVAEASRLELLVRQQEATIQSLTDKLADAVTRSVQASLGRTDSSVFFPESRAVPPNVVSGPDGAPPTGGGGGSGRRRSSSAAAGGAEKARKWSNARRLAAGETVSTSISLLKDLEAVRASERDYLRGAASNAATDLEHMAEKYSAMEDELQVTRAQCEHLRYELRRLYDVFKEMEGWEEVDDPLQDERPPVRLGSGTSSVASSTPMPPQAPPSSTSTGVPLAARSPPADGSGEVVGYRQSAASLGATGEGSDMSTYLPQNHHGAVASELSSPTVSGGTEEYSAWSTAVHAARASTVATRTPSDAKLPQRASTSTPPVSRSAERRGESAGDNLASDDLLSRHASSATPRDVGVHATEPTGVVASLHPPPHPQQSRMSGGFAALRAVFLGSTFVRLMQGGSAAKKGTASSTALGSTLGEGGGATHEPSAVDKSPTKPAADAPAAMLRTTSNTSSRPLPLAVHQKQEKKGARPRSQSGGSPGRTVGPSPHAVATSQRVTGESSTQPSTASAQRARPRAPSSTAEQRTWSSPSTSRRSVVAPRCANCSNMAGLLKAHHQYSTRCITVLRNDLDKLRYAVAVELRDGYTSVRERGELVLQAVMAAPQILRLAGAGLPASSGIPGAPGGSATSAAETPPSNETGLPALRGTEIPLPTTTASQSKTRVPQVAPVPLSVRHLQSTGLEMGRLTTGFPSALQGAEEAHIRAGGGGDMSRWPRERLLDAIAMDSPLAVLKGTQILLPPSQAAAAAPSKGSTLHWTGSDETLLPPSPFAVGYSRKLRQEQQQQQGDALGPLVVGSAGNSNSSTNERAAGGSGARGQKLVTGHGFRQVVGEPTAASEPPSLISFPGGMHGVGSSGSSSGAEVLPGSLPIRYQVMSLDRQTGELRCVERKERAAAVTSASSAATKVSETTSGFTSAFSSAPPRKPTPREINSVSGGTTDIGVEEGLSSEQPAPSKIALMVRELLAESGTRGGLGHGPRRTPYSAPSLTNPRLQIEDGLRILPTEAPVVAAMEQTDHLLSPLQPSRIGDAVAAAAAASVAQGAKSLRDKTVAPVVSINLSKLQRARQGSGAEE